MVEFKKIHLAYLAEDQERVSCYLKGYADGKLDHKYWHTRTLTLRELFEELRVAGKRISEASSNYHQFLMRTLREFRLQDIPQHSYQKCRNPGKADWDTEIVISYGKAGEEGLRIPKAFNPSLRSVDVRSVLYKSSDGTFIDDIVLNEENFNGLKKTFKARKKQIP